MKKIIFTCLTIILCVFNVHASGMSFNVTCPQGAAAGSTVSCTVSASSTSNTSLCAMSAKLSISNATFVSFDQKISLYQNTSSGFVYDSTSCISSNTTIGTLKIKMPNSGSASLTYSNIQASDSTGTIKSTASNVTKTIRVFDNNNNLSNLTVSTGSLSPSFSANTTNYTVNVDGNVSTITIGASASSSKATLSGTGKKNLSYGSNKFTITVKSEAGTTKKYTITVNRADNRSKDNNLSNLSLNNIKMNKAFSSSVTSYTANVDANTTSVQVNAQIKDSKASFVKGYGPRTVNLQFGVNNIEIRVKAENESVKTYTIKVTRADNRSSNNFLKSLSVTNTKFDFNKNTTNYTLNVKNNIDTVEINAEAEDAKSVITGAGSIKLKEGINEAKINVKAENGSIKTYILTIKRLTLQESLSSNTNVTRLEVKNYNINFTKDKLDYVINLKNEKELEINVVLEDETSTTNIVGNENLQDNSLIKIIITSTDGSTKTYNLIIDKSKQENNSSLIYLIIIGIETLLLIGLIVFVISKKSTKSENVENTNLDENTNQSHE